MQGPVRVWEGMQGFASMCEDVQGCAMVCKNRRVHVRAFESILGCAKVYKGV